MKVVFVALLAAIVGCAVARPVLAAEGHQEKVVYSFCSQPNCTDGYLPASSVIDVTGTLFGTTISGGAANEGAVFAVDPKTGVEKVLYSFCSQPNCTDGMNPAASLIDVNGTLYGTTQKGGAAGAGTVFALDPATGAETVVYSFGGVPDGGYPDGSLIDVNGVLYGTTVYGGRPGCDNNEGCGAIFALDPSTGVEKVFYSFCSKKRCRDGRSPNAALIDVKGTLYGTTSEGGTSGKGTVFALDPTTGAENVLYSFCGQQNCADGAFPEDSLIDVKGTLYGTTTGGANKGCRRYGCGTVFALEPKSGSEKVLYAFCAKKKCKDGSDPYTRLIDVKNTLYGTTQRGGTAGGGTVFALNPKTGRETVLHSFNGDPDGDIPLAGLAYVNGQFYGTTEGGGTSGLGSVFALTR